ncbi:MAG: hypothetical protein ACP5JG_01315, partial [Anaerolineae bacterium]
LELTAEERCLLDKHLLLREPVDIARLLGLQVQAGSELPFGGPSRLYLLDLVEGGQGWSTRALYNAFTAIPDALADYARAVLRALEMRETWGVPGEEIITIELGEEAS